MMNHSRVDNKTSSLSQTVEWLRQETWMGTRKQVAARKAAAEEAAVREAEAAKKNQEAMEAAMEAAWQGVSYTDAWVDE